MRNVWLGCILFLVFLPNVIWGQGTATKTLTITVRAPISITTATLNDAVVGTSYSATLAVTGGISPYTWAIQSGSLPTGMALAASTGIISGTPTLAGTYQFVVKVTDSSGTIAYLNINGVIKSERKKPV